MNLRKTTQRLFAFTVTAFAIGFSGSALAYMGTSVDLGTTGLGVHVSFPVRSNLNLNLGLNYFEYSRSGFLSQLHFDDAVILQNHDGLVDYFPFDGRFPITVKVVYNHSHANLVAKPDSSGTIRFNGRRSVAPSAGMVSGNVSFPSLAPYVGVGQSGLTVALSSPVIFAVQTARQMTEAAGQTKDSRMKALAAANPALAGKSAYDAAAAGKGSTINGVPNQIAADSVDANG